MPGTKILNIQKNDSFEEVFDAFQKADAQEVIFIFPKGSVFARDEGYFDTMKAEAERTGKTINVMTTDPIVAQLAVSRKVGVLQNPAPRKRAPMQDIVIPQGNQELPVKETPEPDQEIAISRTPMIPTTPVAPIPVSSDIERLWAEEEQRQNIVPAVPAHRTFSKKLLFIPAGAAVIILGVILFVTVGNAKIIIKPQLEALDFKLKITAGTGTDTVDANFNKIPGQQFVVAKEISGSYPTTAQKEVAQKAAGKIIISSKSATAQRLVATTRFETKEGLIFRIPETVNVPAGGTVSSAVYADRPGKEYNIGPSDFTIPGFKDTPRYAEFSAKSTEPMSGGIVGTAKVVAEQDMVKAKEELSPKAKDEAAKALKEQVGDLKLLADAEIVVAEPIVNAKVGEATDTLEMKVRASATIIAFRPDDIAVLVKAYLEKNGGWELVENKTETVYKLLNTDESKKSMVFEIHITGTGAAKLDKEKILKDIQGMNEEKIRAYFEENKSVLSAKVLLSPRWMTKVPKDPKKIELIIDTSS